MIAVSDRYTWVGRVREWGGRTEGGRKEGKGRREERDRATPSKASSWRIPAGKPPPAQLSVVSSIRQYTWETEGGEIEREGRRDIGWKKGREGGGKKERERERERERGSS